MNWKLWLDDQALDPDSPNRHPPDSSWKSAINSSQAIELIEEFGPPSFISFDHDLGIKDGKEDSAMAVIAHLTDNYYDFEVDYQIHSANPIGIQNIIAKMNSWKKSRFL